MLVAWCMLCICRYSKFILIAMNVEKMDGTIQPFKFDKIVRVVQRVFETKPVCGKVPDKLIDGLRKHFENLVTKSDKKDLNYALPVEDIQNTIRDFLIMNNQPIAVDSFITYRNKKNEIREKKSWLTKDVASKLNGRNPENQNANVDESSFGGRMGEATRVVTKDYALKFCMSKKSRHNHEKNFIYIHDLDSYAVGEHNCLSCPLDNLLLKGFNTRQTDVRSAKSVNTASQLTAVIFQIQSLQQFGGVSATHIDWTMVPFIRRSFEKHYISNWIEDLQEFAELDIEDMSYEDFNNWVEKKTTEFFIETGFEDSDFKFSNKEKFDKKLYQKALKETRDETYQAVEGMYHNLNTLQSRSGNQLPFSSLNYGTCTEREGRMFTKALLEVSYRGLGKFGKTSIFPCGIFQYKKGINDKPGTINYDLKLLALKSTSKRLYPNYANCDWSNQVAWKKLDNKVKQGVIDELTDDERKILVERVKDNGELAYHLSLNVVNDELVLDEREKPEEMFSTMGCRTVNGFDVNFENSYRNNVMQVIKDGTLYDDMTSGVQKDGRGNICPATIILPKIAMLAKKQEEECCTDGENPSSEDIINRFFCILKKKINESKESLIERFRYVTSQPAASAKFMYENHTMSGYVESEGIVSALRHGTLTIGQIGIAETVYILTGDYHTTPAGMEVAKKIEQLFLDKCNQFKKETNLNFGVYYTPAESLCYTAFKKFKAEYGDMEGVTYFVNDKGEREDKMYFTNSIHVPVYLHMTPFEKIDIEKQLTGYSNAGCITYIEVDHDVVHNIKALEDYVDYAMDNDIPYFAINCPSDTCTKCGYQGNIADKCPVCGSDEIERLRRVTGYLTGDYHAAFNEGKQCETDDRVKHKKEVNL